MKFQANLHEFVSGELGMPFFRMIDTFNKLTIGFEG